VNESNKSDVHAHYLPHPYGPRCSRRVTIGPTASRRCGRVITKAGGDAGEDGEPVGEAQRDADQIRAADLVLQVAGEKEQRQEHLHKHVHLAFGDMSVAELEKLGTTGKWPERYRALAEKVATRGTDG